MSQNTTQPAPAGKAPTSLRLFSETSFGVASPGSTPLREGHRDVYDVRHPAKWGCEFRCECGGGVEVVGETHNRATGVPCDSCDKTYTIEHRYDGDDWANG